MRRRSPAGSPARSRASRSRITSRPRKPATWTPSSITGWRRRSRPCAMPGLPTNDALSEEEAERIGCLVGSGIGGLPLIEETHAELTARGPAPHHAVLRAGVDHQHDLRPRLDHLRLPGPEPGDRHRLHDRPALHRRGRAPDRVRRCRRDGRRRCRGDRVAARRRRLRRGARAVDPQRRPADRVAPVGPATATASSSAKAPACWCSRSTSTPSAVAPRSTPSSPASAWVPTPST